MNTNEIRYMIEDYCSRYEIDITAAQVIEAAGVIAEDIADAEEYNIRCGIHSVNVDAILDRYFDDFLMEDNAE